jgi:hypothetical protein
MVEVARTQTPFTALSLATKRSWRPITSQPRGRARPRYPEACRRGYDLNKCATSEHTARA